MNINLNLIFRLYKEYQNDLRKVRKIEKQFLHKYGYNRIETTMLYIFMRKWITKLGLRCNRNVIHPQCQDIECEILYLLIRGTKPQIIVELGSHGGWSTSWLLNGIKDNGDGMLYSYDRISLSHQIIPSNLQLNWIFTKGDIRRNVSMIPDNIDMIFIDAEHTLAFAKWYVANIFSKVRKGGIIIIHDMFPPPSTPEREKGESRYILNWIQNHNIPYFSLDLQDHKLNYDVIVQTKLNLKILKDIHIPYIFELNICTRLKQILGIISKSSNFYTNNCQIIIFEK